MQSARQALIQQFEREGREVIDWMLYDSLKTTASSSQQLVFFQQAVGGVGRARTNMKNTGNLPSPQSMLIEEIWCYICNSDGLSFQFDATAHDFPLNIMINTGYWDFKLEPSTMYEGHMLELMGQINEQVFQDSGVDTVPFGANGWAGRIKMRKPIIVGSSRAFSLVMNLTTPAAGDGYVEATTLIYWILKGRLRRNH